MIQYSQKKIIEPILHTGKVSHAYCMVLQHLTTASTFPPVIEAPQLGIMSANLTVNHPNISVWVIHEQKRKLFIS